MGVDNTKENVPLRKNSTETEYEKYYDFQDNIIEERERKLEERRREEKRLQEEMNKNNRQYIPRRDLGMNGYTVPCPNTKDYFKWILIPLILSIFTCGIGGIILMVVWACSSEERARRNLMRALLIIQALPLIIGIAIYTIAIYYPTIPTFN